MPKRLLNQSILCFLDDTGFAFIFLFKLAENQRLTLALSLLWKFCQGTEKSRVLLLLSVSSKGSRRREGCGEGDVISIEDCNESASECRKESTGLAEVEEDIPDVVGSIAPL